MERKINKKDKVPSIKSTEIQLMIAGTFTSVATQSKILRYGKSPISSRSRATTLSCLSRSLRLKLVLSAVKASELLRHSLSTTSTTPSVTYVGEQLLKKHGCYLIQVERNI